MTNRRCLSQMLWPSNPSESQLPVEWAASVAVNLLDCIWRSYDQIIKKHKNTLNFNQDILQLERGLTEIHFHEIQLIWRNETNGFASVVPSHEADEFESLHSPSAKPIAYDLCFIHFVNTRWKFPIEAKVLQTDAALTDYLSDVKDKFVTGRAAPLVGFAGMIGYLLEGSPEKVLSRLEIELQQALQQVPAFAERPHRVSHHPRSNAPHLNLSHMIMILK